MLSKTDCTHCILFSLPTFKHKYLTAISSYLLLFQTVKFSRILPTFENYPIGMYSFPSPVQRRCNWLINYLITDRRWFTYNSSLTGQTKCLFYCLFSGAMLFQNNCSIVCEVQWSERVTCLFSESSSNKSLSRGRYRVRVVFNSDCSPNMRDI